MVFGVDSHRRSLCVCAVDGLGREGAAGEFASDPAGHRALVGWAAGVEPAGGCLGIEGTGHHADTLAGILVAAWVGAGGAVRPRRSRTAALTARQVRSSRRPRRCRGRRL